MINKRILKTGALAVAMTVVFAIFAFRAADWTKGLNSEFIVYGQSSGSGGSSGSTGSTGVNSSPTTKVLPQISVGNFGLDFTYGTVIQVSNPNSSAITVNAKFYSEDGSPATLTFSTNQPSQPTFSGSLSNLSLAANSILVMSVGVTQLSTPDTNGMSQAKAQGKTIWGIVTGSNTISVASFFDLRHTEDYSIYSRVGIAASLPNMTSFLVPRVREKISSSQSAEIETGFAVVNTGTTAAIINAKLYDASGNLLASGNIPLAAGQHKALFVGSAFQALSDLAGRQYQYILFTSNQPTIAAAAIAFEGGALTSFPVDPIS